MPSKKSYRWLKRLIFLIVIIFILVILFFNSIIITPPKVPNIKNFKTEKINDSLTICAHSWLKHNSYNLWEFYIEGNPYERGIKTGMLTKPLIEEQEKAFVAQILKMVPSKTYLNFLKYIVAFFNRNIDKYIPLENLQEIYGISQYSSKKYSFIGPAYSRILNYHAAHDIGHALITYHMVGCTSFAVKNKMSADSSLLIARNFDFYVGDEFAKNKIVEFVKPDSGYKFMFITWGGMLGACSGMNEKGLAVTINAGTSEIPYSVATPISIVVRNILQYAKNINEAKQIAGKFKIFVSESILVGSAIDNDAVIIEKTPAKQFVYKSYSDYLICTNHFQSDSLKGEKNNIENMLNSSSLYRYFRVKELLSQYNVISPVTAATILRNRGGLNNKDIGMGNEKSINQLIAHHSIIFQPKKLKVYVSTSPYQLGSYLVYDLNKIFSAPFDIKNTKTVYNVNETIKPDRFLYSAQYKKFKYYKICKEYIVLHTNNKSFGEISNVQIEQFKNSNPNYYYTWQIVGDYFKSRKQFNEAIKCYKYALTLEISTLADKKNIEESIMECAKN